MNAPRPLPPTPQQLIDAVRHTLPDASALWLFGSVARQAMRQDSDIDLAVWLPQPLGGEAKWQAATALALRLGYDVDLLDFARLPTVMQFQVLATGTLLFAQDPARLADYSAFVQTEYLHIQRWRQPMMAALAHDLQARPTGALAHP